MVQKATRWLPTRLFVISEEKTLKRWLVWQGTGERNIGEFSCSIYLTFKEVMCSWAVSTWSYYHLMVKKKSGCAKPNCSVWFFHFKTRHFLFLKKKQLFYKWKSFIFSIYNKLFTIRKRSFPVMDFLFCYCIFCLVFIMPVLFLFCLDVDTRQCFYFIFWYGYLLFYSN